MANVDRMSEVEAEVNKKLIERVTLLREAAIEAERQKEAAVADIDNAEMDIKTNVAAYNMSEAGKSAPISLGEVQKLLTEHKKLINAQSEIEASANKVFMTMRSGSADAGTSLK
jgi:hypothetical protein